MTCTDASGTGFKSWKTHMILSTACVSSLFVTSTDSGSPSGNPCKRSRPPAGWRARHAEENQKPQVLKRRLEHPHPARCIPSVILASIQITSLKHSSNLLRLKLDSCQTRLSWCTTAVFGMKDRKSTRLNSSHGYISYAVFCLKKKKKKQHSLIYNNTR